MAEQFARLVVPKDLLEDLQKIATEAGVTLSTPQLFDSTSEALNAPMVGADTITNIGHVVTALFATATAIITFSIKLTELLEKRKARMLIINTANPSKGQEIDGSTTSEAITKVIQNVPNSSS